MNDAKKGKVFLCHSSSDKYFVKRLAQILESQGVKVWYDDWEIGVGDSIRRKIEKGIISSSYMGVILSKEFVKSEWAQTELDAGFEKQIAKKDIYLLPILLEDCEIPPLLKPKKYADFRKNYSHGLLQILSVILDKPELLKEIDRDPLNPYYFQFVQLGGKYKEFDYQVIDCSVDRLSDFIVISIESPFLETMPYDTAKHYVSIIKAHLTLELIKVSKPQLEIGFIKSGKLIIGECPIDKCFHAVIIDEYNHLKMPNIFIRGLEELGIMSLWGSGIYNGGKNVEWMFQLILEETEHIKNKYYRLLYKKFQFICRQIKNKKFHIKYSNYL